MDTDISIFPDKTTKPDNDDLIEVLGSSYDLWMNIRNYVFEQYPKAVEEWNYPGKKYGWSFRIKDKKRAIIYLLPRDHYFKVAFVFGQKATDEILQSNLPEEIKSDLQQARKYAEGRGISLDVRDASILPDIKQLVDIKLNW